MARILLALLLACLAAAPARAASAPDEGIAFEPAPKSQPVYGTKPPSDDPAGQKHVVEAADGVDLYVETWLPAPKDGNVPPARVPVVLIMTPYVQEDVERYTTRNLANVAQWFTTRGYGVAQHHVRGTGGSGGCLEQTAANQIDDGARVVAFLGRDAPYASGAVGMYGHSYDAETQVSVAGRGDPALTQYLKAIVPSASVGGQYEYSNMDGVPYAGQALLSNAGYLAVTSLAPGDAPVGANTFERFGCVQELMLGAADQTGDLTPFWQVREYRPDAGSIRAATLWVHGLADWNVQPIAVTGFFERLPAGTPHKGMFGQWEHNYPDRHAGVQPQWARQDFLAVVTAWYDRYLKGLDTGVESWPAVQLQGTDGVWRAAPDFPQTGGPAGHLALGAEGALGVQAPEGSTSFTEGPDDEETIPGSRVVVETPALAGPLHLSGQPVLDLWLVTDSSDAHLTAKLQVIDGEGAPVVHEGSASQELGTHGARSLRHLAPMPSGYFEQAAGEPAPTGEPLRVPLRFQPVDLVAPAGSRIRVTVAGGTAWARLTAPSGSVAGIELLHDCEHTSALRFLTPRAADDRLNVRETDEAQAGPLPSAPAPLGTRDGGGLASAPVCGRPPERLASFGPEVPAAGPQPPGGPATCSPAQVATRRGRVTRRGVRIAGTASGCRAPILVEVARVSARRCRFVGRDGRLGRRRSCARGPRLRARGFERWTLRTRRRLPRGRYFARVRAGADGRAVRIVLAR